jgi:hypothetical protein
MSKYTPLYIVGAAAAVVGIWYVTKPSATAAAATVVAKSNLVAGPTGPQSMTRDQKIALFKKLPGTQIANFTSDKLGDSGVLILDGIPIPSGATTGPALDVIYTASMTGRAVLAKQSDTLTPNGTVKGTYLLVAAPGTETATASPGSEWFIFLQSKEADAIASVSNVAIPPVLKGGAPSPPAPDTGKPKFIPLIGNPFRNNVLAQHQSMIRSMLVSAQPVDNAHLDLKKLPEPLKSNVQKAVDSDDWHTVVAWADNARDNGYTVAAQQLYDKAREDGWSPDDGWEITPNKHGDMLWRYTNTDHPELMTFLEMIRPYSHPHILYQNQVNRMVIDGIARPDPLWVAPDGWVEYITALYTRASGSPMPDDDVNLRNSASALRSVNYIKAAEDLEAIANTISPDPAVVAAKAAADQAAADAAAAAAAAAAAKGKPPPGTAKGALKSGGASGVNRPGGF